MLFHGLGLLYTFLIAAFFSAGITLTPITIAWSSIWVYVAFIAALFPGYILAWGTIVLVTLIPLMIVAAIGSSVNRR